MSSFYYFFLKKILILVPFKIWGKVTSILVVSIFLHLERNTLEKRSLEFSKEIKGHQNPGKALGCGMVTEYPVNSHCFPGFSTALVTDFRVFRSLDSGFTVEKGHGSPGGKVTSLRVSSDKGH